MDGLEVTEGEADGMDQAGQVCGGGGSHEQGSRQNRRGDDDDRRTYGSDLKGSADILIVLASIDGGRCGMQMRDAGCGMRDAGPPGGRESRVGQAWK